METEYSYNCPNCSKECSVPESLIGQNLTCPNCSRDFFATSPEPQAPPLPDEEQTGFALPEKLPFFKWGRKHLLKERVDQLLAAGPLDGTVDELETLTKTLGLEHEDLAKICREHFMVEFRPIQERMESSFVMTDGDLQEINQLKKKYAINLELGGNAGLFRSIYLLETAGQLPPPIQTTLMLSVGESVYFSVASAWHQVRLQNRGYSGTSVSIPTGVKGVRFRFGGYSPARSEELTLLSNGVLYVTSKRLLFNGETRNTQRRNEITLNLPV